MRSIKFWFRVGKMSIVCKIWNFLHELKFHLGLAKPSWNFNLLYRVEIFACNCNVILKRSLLFNRDKILTRLTCSNFNLGWKSPYNQPLLVIAWWQLQYNQIFSEFLICYNNTKIWETTKIFATLNKINLQKLG